jgi:hypothetical protein
MTYSEKYSSTLCRLYRSGIMCSFISIIDTVVIRFCLESIPIENYGTEPGAA